MGRAKGAVLALGLLVLSAVAVRLLAARAPARAPETPATVPTCDSCDPHVAAPAPQAACSLDVLVRNDDGPLAGAAVALHGGASHGFCGSRVTDATGHVRFDGLAAGQYELQASHAEHRSADQTATVDGASRVEIALARGARVVGLVIETSGATVAAAVVRAVAAESDDEFGVARTNEAGEFTLPGLPVGTLRLYVHTGRHRPKFTEPMRFAREGETQRITVQVERGRTIRGRVTARDGAPMAGAQVGGSDDGCLFVTTDDQGHFELGGLGDEPVNIFALADGFAAAHVRGVRPDTMDAHLILEASGRVVGTIVAGAPLREFEAALVTFDAYFGQELRVAAVAVEAPETAFAFDDVAAGEYWLEIVAVGHAPARVPLRAIAGETVDVGGVALKGVSHGD